MGAVNRVSDPAELLPPFRRAVEMLLERMRASGHAPALNETYRTPERAAMLAEAGRGQANSLHTWRVAADLICERHQWDCGKHGCDFYSRLGLEAERLGMTWGGRWERRDLVHVQGIPVAVQQSARRATLPELEELLGEYLRP